VACQSRPACLPAAVVSGCSGELTSPVKVVVVELTKHLRSLEVLAKGGANVNKADHRDRLVRLAVHQVEVMHLAREKLAADRRELVVARRPLVLAREHARQLVYK
jgi:hypothetical protein